MKLCTSVNSFCTYVFTGTFSADSSGSRNHQVQSQSYSCRQLEHRRGAWTVLRTLLLELSCLHGIGPNLSVGFEHYRCFSKKPSLANFVEPYILSRSSFLSYEFRVFMVV